MVKGDKWRATLLAKGGGDETVTNVYFSPRGSYISPRIGIVLPIVAPHPHLTSLQSRKTNINTNMDTKVYSVANPYQIPGVAHAHAEVKQYQNPDVAYTHSNSTSHHSRSAEG